MTSRRGSRSTSRAWGKIFEEVAKFRAGRRLYARMLRERFRASNPRSWMFRSLIGGGGSAFAVQEPENNIVRGAYIALAGALAGAQTMALPTYDEAYTIPSPKAQLIALRTMQICAEESGAADTADPLAGSYYVEALTDRDGEADPSTSWPTSSAWAASSRRSRAAPSRPRWRARPTCSSSELVSGEIPKVAVNCHVGEGAASRPTARWSCTRSIRGRPRRSWRGSRGSGAIGTAAPCRPRSAGSPTRRAARGNLMYPIIEAVKAYATLGEIARAMKAVFGEHQEAVKF